MADITNPTGSHKNASHLPLAGEGHKKIRVRMAPSPTGPLHIGTAWMTLFDYLFARHEGGTFILRIEDTDPERSKTEYEIGLIEGLHWLGIDWDEGPTLEKLETGNWKLGEKGKYGPYRDSDRIVTHKNYIKKFLDEGKAYQCYCTKEELDAARKVSEAKGVPFRYPGTCRELTAAPAGKTPQVIRLKMPNAPISWNDIVRGEVTFAPQDLDDFAIARSDGSPLYNFSVVINDYEMEITHVVRGEDHISNTPKQIVVYMALGATPPQFAHVPLILNPDRSKMSKRYGDTTVAEYRARGYLPDALLNFLVLLGWHPRDEQEIFSHEELIEKFELTRVRKSGAVFDQAKLDWINREYIKKMSVEELTHLAIPFLKEAGLEAPNEFIERVIAAEQVRVTTLKDFAEQGRFYFVLPDYEADLLIWKKMTRDEVKPSLERTLAAFEKLSLADFTREKLSATLDALVVDGEKGKVFWPLRVALSGLAMSPDPVEIAIVLSKDETLRRIQVAIDKLA